MPDIKRLERVQEVVAGLVKEDITNAPAEDDAECRPHQKVVDVLAANEAGRPSGESEAVTPPDQQTDDIGERVPADRDRTERDRDRIDRRKRDRKKRHQPMSIPGQPAGSL